MDASTTRRQLLKAYLVSLAAEGAFKGAKTPAAAVARAVQCITEDVPAVVGEMIGEIARDGASKVADVVGSALQELSRRASSMKVREIVSGVADTYRRGLDRVGRREK